MKSKIYGAFPVYVAPRAKLTPLSYAILSTIAGLITLGALEMFYRLTH
jgi:hypothetical protein